jgi:FkbM family methyltransferase
MKYDYVDIGTCYFEVADGVFAPDKNYLLVEPMAEYLDRLPTGDNIKKENSACSDKNGSIEIFYVPESVILELNLPLWMKGCSKINEPHKVVLNYLNAVGIGKSIINSKTINVISFKKLVEKYNIEHIENLKIDTEGHDHIILNEVARLLSFNKISCDSITVEYIIGRYGNTDEIDSIAYSLRKTFPNIKIQSENLTLSK